jgi:hypothetical protein
MRYFIKAPNADAHQDLLDYLAGTRLRVLAVSSRSLSIIASGRVAKAIRRFFEGARATVILMEE